MNFRQSLPPHPPGLAIGLFGGSFNPAHSGHVHVADTALKRLGLQRIWWIPARGNPLKSEHGNFAARLAWARGAARRARMIVTPIEAEAGITYTADLVRLLKRRAPGARFVWIMGADSLGSFHRWKNWQTIVRTLPVAVIARPGFAAKARLSPFARRFAASRLPETEARRLAFCAAPAWVCLKAPFDPASSTALRAAAS